jgi:Tol biopolymer transport system component
LRDIGDARLDLQDPEKAQRTVGDALDGKRRAPSLLWSAAVILLAVGAVVALGSDLWRTPSPPSPRLERLKTALPHGANVTRGPGVASSVAVSPDGRTIVVAASDTRGQRLYHKPIDQLEFTPIAGTERGSSPFFSWDGASIGFAADGWLKRVPAGGGAAANIVQLAGFPAGASWGPDDRIVFAYGADSPLHVVDARGGRAEVLTPGQIAYRPETLPDGTVLYESASWVHVFDRRTGSRTQLVKGTAPRFANGHLIVAEGTDLFAAPLDLPGREIGRMDPLLERVAEEAGTIGGMAHYAVSREGTLVYVPAEEAYSLVVVQADGAEHKVTTDQFRFQTPRFSEDGNRIVVAVGRRAKEPSDIWLHDLRTGAATRLTFDGGNWPLWGPDGNTITYSRPPPNRGSGIYTVPADGRGSTRQLLGLSAMHRSAGWTRDGRTLAYFAMEGTPSSVFALTSHALPRRVIGPGSIWSPKLSPDGRWLAYGSLDSGSFEVFVTPFPEGSPRWPIAEGTDPAWSPGGAEIYYRRGVRLMAARIDTTGGVVRGTSHRVVHEPFLPPLYDDYDIHRDGRTLVVVRPANPVQLREVFITSNWQEQLKRSASEDP